MLGSINTGGFSKSQVDAMKDSNYFQRKGIPGIYNAPNPTAKRDTAPANAPTPKAAKLLDIPHLCTA